MAGLLGLVEAATAAGWSTRRAALVLGLDLDRIRRWVSRRATGQLDDRRPGSAVHGILPSEREAIIELAEAWGARLTGPTVSSRIAAAGSGWCTCRSRRCCGC